MRSGIINPRILSVGYMSSRLKIFNNHPNVSLFQTTNFSQGGLIDIVLSIIPTFCIEIMETDGLEHREKRYEELIENMGENSQHHLDVYLTSLLPKIGLDPETYAPYITGLLPTPEEDIEQRRNMLA